MPGGIDSEEDGSGGGVIDGDEGRQGGDGVLESYHRLVVLLLPLELHVLACEIDEGFG